MGPQMTQSVLMAITATVNKYTSTNARAIPKKAGKNDGRRTLLFSTVVAALPVVDSKTELLKKYLKISEENKAKNDKERVESYYKRNYKDYFGYVEGTVRGKKEEELTESEKGILDWLKRNQ